MVAVSVGRYLDVSEARQNAEAWERNHARLLRDYAEVLAKVKRLEGDNAHLEGVAAKLRREVAALTDAASGDAGKLLASLASERDRKDKAVARAFALQSERDAALTAARVAQRALDAARVPVDSRPSIQDRANHYALSDANDKLRAQIEQFERDIAALRSLLGTREQEHP